MVRLCPAAAHPGFLFRPAGVVADPAHATQAPGREGSPSGINRITRIPLRTASLLLQ